jgi:hypothetical protein
MSVVASTTPGSCFSCFSTAEVQATPQTMPSTKKVTLRSSGAGFDSGFTTAVFGDSGGVGFSPHPMLKPSIAIAVINSAVDGKKFIVFGKAKVGIG